MDPTVAQSRIPAVKAHRGIEMNDRNWPTNETADRQSFNPYEATEFTSDESPLSEIPSNAEAIRKEHLNHEASIRAIGMLYMLGAVLVILGGAALLTRGILLRPTGEDAIVIVAFCFINMALGAVQFVIGRGLRNFGKSARIGGIVLSCIGLLAVPIGTLISGYFVYLLAGRKGQYIFSDEYQAIRLATPQIVYRTSMIVWVLAALLVLLLIIALIGGILAVVS
jgi:hypothetical protein